MRPTVNILPFTETGTSKPLFVIEECDFGVICKSINCESVYWYDNKGSVGKFYNFLGINKNEAILKENNLNNKLIDLTVENLADIKDDLLELLKIFEIGKYAINFSNSFEGHNENGFNYYNIIFPEHDKSEFTEENLKIEFERKFKNLLNEYGNNTWMDITDFSAVNFYDGYEAHILATKHKNNLDQSRIAFYREQIQKGKRPPIIILTCTTNRQSILNSFIIDGHHKAIAYIQEEVNPALITIDGEAKYCTNTLSKLKQASNNLYKDQFEYLISSRYSFDSINEEICKDEQLKSYCRNGLIEKYYPTGQLKMRCNYLNNKKHGYLECFYPDGSIEKREKYENGRYVCTYESYFHNGQLLQKGDENGIMESYDIYGNRIK